MTQPSVKKNYIYRTLYEVLTLITPFITTPYVARVLGAGGVGDYSYTYSIISYFMLFGGLGTASYGAREIARNRDNKALLSKLFWEIQIMTFFTTGICLLLWLCVISFYTKYRAIFLALTPFLFGTMFDISWFFTGLERVKNIVLRNSIIKIAGIVLLFLLVKKKEDIILYCIINSLTTLLGNLSMWLYLPKIISKVDFRQLQFRNHLHETLVYFIPTVATSIYTVLDKTLIGTITGSSYQNGYYEEATKIIKVVKSVVFVAVNSVMGARISYLFVDDKIDEIKRRISRSLDFIYLLAFGAGFGIIGVSRRFIPLFLGEGFEPVIPLLCIMTPLILIIGTSNCLGNLYYTPSGQRKRSAKVIVLGACCNLCLNLLLIPKLGATGATIASIIAELLITILYVQMSQSFMTWNQIWLFSWKRLLVGSLMCSVVYVLGITIRTSDIVTVAVQVAAGMIFYVGLLLILKDSMANELLNMMFKFLRKRNQISFFHDKGAN